MLNFNVGEKKQLLLDRSAQKSIYWKPSRDKVPKVESHQFYKQNWNINNALLQSWDISKKQEINLYINFLRKHTGRGAKKRENNKSNKTGHFKWMLISKPEGRLSWYWHFARSYPWPVPFYLDLDRELELEEREDERERDEPERLPLFLAGLSSSSLASRLYFDRSPSSSSSSSSWRRTNHCWAL